MFEKKNIAAGFIKGNNRKWKKKEQAVFLFRLGELLNSGYHLAEAIMFLQAQESDKRKIFLDKAIGKLRAGHSLFEVLSFLEFDAPLLQFVYYAEFYGDLPHALMEGGSFWEKRNKDREQFYKVLIYPMLLLVLILVIFSLLQGILLPKFQSLYDSMNMDPTFFLKTIILLSTVSPFVPYISVGLVIIAFLLKKFFLDRLCPLQRKTFLLKIPFLGSYIRMFDTYYMSYQLSSLLSGGLSINDSMRLFTQHNHMPFFQKIGSEIFRDLNEGKSLDGIFNELPYFETYLSDVMANGQKNGKLDKELFHYSRILIEKIEERVSSLIKIVQPLLFASVGFIVIAIYLSVLLPMFSIIEGL